MKSCQKKERRKGADMVFSELGCLNKPWNRIAGWPLVDRGPLSPPCVPSTHGIRGHETWRSQLTKQNVRAILYESNGSYIGMGYFTRTKDESLLDLSKISKRRVIMSTSICGLDCTKCNFNTSCTGCTKTNGKPFGGTCMVAECCKNHKNGTCGDFSKQICVLKKTTDRRI